MKNQVRTSKVPDMFLLEIANRIIRIQVRHNTWDVVHYIVKLRNPRCFHQLKLRAGVKFVPPAAHKNTVQTQPAGPAGDKRDSAASSHEKPDARMPINAARSGRVKMCTFLRTSVLLCRVNQKTPGHSLLSVSTMSESTCYPSGIQQHVQEKTG